MPETLDDGRSASFVARRRRASETLSGLSQQLEPYVPVEGECWCSGVLTDIDRP